MEIRAELVRVALALEEQLIQVGIRNGDTFEVKTDHSRIYPYKPLCDRVYIPSEEKVDSEEWVYDNEGNDVCTPVRESKWYSVIDYPTQPKVMGMGSERAVYNYASDAELCKFINEARRLLNEPLICLAPSCNNELSPTCVWGFCKEHTETAPHRRSRKSATYRN